MKARIIKTRDSKLQILCQNGTIKNCADQVLAKFLTQFASHTFLYELNGEDGIWRDSSFDMAEYPGETLAYVTDTLQLIVFNPELFISMVSASYVPSQAAESDNNMIKYISVQEYAKRHNRAEAMIRVLCKDKRIPGAKKIARTWVIPENAPYPISPSNRKK